MRAFIPALAASLLIGCSAPSEDPEPTPTTPLHADAVDGSTSAADGGDSGTGTSFPAESDPEGRVATPTDSDTGCAVAGHDGRDHDGRDAGGALFCLAAVALALVSAKRRSCT